MHNCITIRLIFRGASQKNLRGVDATTPPPARERVKVLVTALVFSRVRYCLTVYGSGSQKNFNRPQNILNFAMKVIFGRRKFDHVSDLREQLRWMTPQQLTQPQTLELMHRVLLRGEPHSLAGLFVGGG